MKPDDASRLLDRAAQRARTRPTFLGWVLARYEDLESMQTDRLQQQLGVSADEWSRLQLCLRPREDSFLQDVTQIASEFGIDRATLAALIRRVDAVEAVQNQERPGRTGSLLAARTRKPRPPNPET